MQIWIPIRIHFILAYVKFSNRLKLGRSEIPRLLQLKIFERRTSSDPLQFEKGTPSSEVHLLGLATPLESVGRPAIGQGRAGSLEKNYRAA